MTLMTSILLQVALGLGIGYQLADKKGGFNTGWLFIILFASYLVYLNNQTIFENYLSTTLTALVVSYLGSLITKKNDWMYLISIICGLIAMILIIAKMIMHMI